LVLAVITPDDVAPRARFPVPALIVVELDPFVLPRATALAAAPLPMLIVFAAASAPRLIVDVPVDVMPPVKVCSAVHVGAMACDNAGAASLRMAVVAVPFTAVRPIVAEGLAKPLNDPGRSADVSALNDGAPLPDVGPAKTKFWDVVAAPVPPLAIGRMLLPTAADEARLMLPKSGVPPPLETRNTWFAVPAVVTITAEVPLPSITPLLLSVVAPVPPLLTGRVPVKEIWPALDSAMLPVALTAIVPEASGSVYVLPDVRSALVMMPGKRFAPTVAACRRI